jgi:DNA-directed RNA polymerase subunit RPC12/RpoP
MDFEEEVKTHTRRVELGERVLYAQACPHCGAVEKESFRWHDCRRRKFRLVVEQYIQIALSWILRWRCLRCGKRFTDYPPFCFATEAVRQATGVGEGWRVSGNRAFLP